MTPLETFSFSQIQLCLKQAKWIQSRGREQVSLCQKACPKSNFSVGLEAVDSKEQEVTEIEQKDSGDETLKEKNLNCPIFEDDCHFYFMEIESLNAIKQSIELGTLTFTKEQREMFEQAIAKNTQTVLFLSPKDSGSIRGFVTIDSEISMQSEDLICKVTWEWYGETSNATLETMKLKKIITGTEIPKTKGCELCRYFFESGTFNYCNECLNEKSITTSLDQSNINEFNDNCKSTTKVVSLSSLCLDLNISTEKNVSNEGILAERENNPASLERKLNPEKDEFVGETRRRSLDKRAAANHYDMPPRKRGVVVKFSQQKGYGFIRPDFDFGSGKQMPDIFVHRSSIVAHSKVPTLRVGQKTEFDVTLDPRTDKPHAVNVTGPDRNPLDGPGIGQGLSSNSSSPNRIKSLTPNLHKISVEKLERISGMRHPEQRGKWRAATLMHPPQPATGKVWNSREMSNAKKLPTNRVNAQNAWTKPGVRTQNPEEGYWQNPQNTNEMVFKGRMDAMRKEMPKMKKSSFPRNPTPDHDAKSMTPNGKFSGKENESETHWRMRHGKEDATIPTSSKTPNGPPPPGIFPQHTQGHASKYLRTASPPLSSMNPYANDFKYMRYQPPYPEGEFERASYMSGQNMYDEYHSRKQMHDMYHQSYQRQYQGYHPSGKYDEEMYGYNDYNRGYYHEGYSYAQPRPPVQQYDNNMRAQRSTNYPASANSWTEQQRADSPPYAPSNW